MSATSQRGGVGSARAGAAGPQRCSVVMGSLRRAGRYVLWEAEEVEGAAYRPQVLATHLEIADGGRQGAMPQEDLDGAGINPRVEEMGGKAVAQRMHARPPLQLRPLAGTFVDFAGRPTGHRLGEEAARE